MADDGWSLFLKLYFRCCPIDAQRGISEFGPETTKDSNLLKLLS